MRRFFKDARQRPNIGSGSTYEGFSVADWKNFPCLLGAFHMVVFLAKPLVNRLTIHMWAFASHPTHMKVHQ
jgi:hypothetical protein